MTVAYVCPVRLFSPQVEAWLALFDITYTLRVTGLGGVQWERVALPAVGGIEDQPAVDLLALDWIARVWNGWLAEQRPRRAAGERP